MPESLMYYEGHFVLIDPDRHEQFLTTDELRVFLSGLLATMTEQDLPKDLQKLGPVDQKLDRLINTCCDLDCGDRGLWQWYAVRLQKD